MEKKGKENENASNVEIPLLNSHENEFMFCFNVFKHLCLCVSLDILLISINNVDSHEILYSTRTKQLFHVISLTFNFLLISICGSGICSNLILKLKANLKDQTTAKLLTHNKKKIHEHEHANEIQLIY